MDIDPYKIPAFQRKNKISFKGSSFRVSKEPDEKVLSNPKRHDFSVSRTDSIAKISKPPAYISRQSESAASTVSNWRKMDRVGEVDHYFANIDVIAFKLEKPLKIGERIIIESPNGLFEQELISMQINRQDVKTAKRGDDVGIKVKFKPLQGGSVYKVSAQGK